MIRRVRAAGRGLMASLAVLVVTEACTGSVGPTPASTPVYDGTAHVTTTALYDPKTGTFSPTSPGG